MRGQRVARLWDAQKARAAHKASPTGGQQHCLDLGREPAFNGSQSPLPRSESAGPER